MQKILINEMRQYARCGHSEREGKTKWRFFCYKSHAFQRSLVYDVKKACL